MSKPDFESVAEATAFIDTAALQSNALLVRAIAPEAQLLFIVKANAYGHGAYEVASALDSIAHSFGVARVDEAIALRKRGIEQKIIVLSDHLTETSLRQMLKYQLVPVLYSDLTLPRYLDFCETNKLEYWLKLDTGMGRLGLRDTALNQILQEASHCSTMMTHFHSADDCNLAKTTAQLTAFTQQMNAADINPLFSCANSAALLNHADENGYSEWMRRIINTSDLRNDIVRPGIMLYGADPLASPTELSKQLRPVMSFCAPVLDVRQVLPGDSIGYNQRWTATKPSFIATVAAGYGDGYPRHALNDTPVLIQGQRGKLVGTVSMDMIGVDVTEMINTGIDVVPGDTAELWGHNLPVSEIAKWSGSINYQLLTGLASRVPRIYV